MRLLIWGKTFIKAFKRVIKKHPMLRDEIEATLWLLSEEPFASQLATHKLKGELSGLWACSVGYDMRVIFEFVESEEQNEDDIFLLDIGTHDEVY